MNGAFFQFLGRFQVTIQKYGFSQISETDVVEMKIRFVIFHHYWITLWESRTISLVHFVIGLKPFSRTVYGTARSGSEATFSLSRYSIWYAKSKNSNFRAFLIYNLQTFYTDSCSPTPVCFDVKNARNFEC